MATLLKTDGTQVPLKPRSGTFDFINEIFPRIAPRSTAIQHINLSDGRIMLLDEQAKLRNPGPPINHAATRILQEHQMSDASVVGDVIICSRKEVFRNLALEKAPATNKINQRASSV